MYCRSLCLSVCLSQDGWGASILAPTALGSSRASGARPTSRRLRRLYPRAYGPIWGRYGGLKLIFVLRLCANWLTWTCKKITKSKLVEGVEIDPLKYWRPFGKSGSKSRILRFPTCLGLALQPMATYILTLLRIADSDVIAIAATSDRARV